MARPGERPHREGLSVEYDDLQDQHKLVVRLPRTVAAGERFKLRTRTRCVPSDNILEGIYKDTTPPGAPQQFMSQCQQWGFQRIMPIFDDCRAKCTMTTVIEADARYTHLISNGNISRDQNPDAAPELKPNDPTRKIITFENDIPMAPYLFLACVGTWDTLADEVILDSGKKVRLEYLVPPGRDRARGHPHGHLEAVGAVDEPDAEVRLPKRHVPDHLHEQIQFRRHGKHG